MDFILLEGMWGYISNPKYFLKTTLKSFAHERNNECNLNRMKICIIIFIIMIISFNSNLFKQITMIRRDNNLLIVIQRFFLFLEHYNQAKIQSFFWFSLFLIIYKRKFIFLRQNYFKKDNLCKIENISSKVNCSLFYS